MKCNVKKDWIKVELEHTKDWKVARKIACDHYKEFGSAYYPALKKMEQSLKAKVKSKK